MPGPRIDPPGADTPGADTHGADTHGANLCSADPRSDELCGDRDRGTSPAHPARVAIVGAGPAGLFAAQALAAQDEQPVEVDIYDRLPTPYGLLRYGVAPDHTSIKGVASSLAAVFASPAIRFRGLVEFGADVTREELLAAYDAVVYAAGASEDLRMNVPGESLPGSRSAREFVAWYGGHPDASPQDLTTVTAAAAVGVGNVAVDVARLLVKHTDELEWTDMPPAVLDELARHTVGDVWIVGRRGPHHASFTTKELRELCAIEGVQVGVSTGAFDGIDEADLDRRTRANVQVLREAARRQVPQARCRLHFLFWRRPVRVEGTDRVTGLTVEQTRLDEAGRVVGTGRTATLDVQLVLRAIGYRGLPLPGLPFDLERGVIPNDEGRLLTEEGDPLAREYAVGWIKRGPIGVIGTNKSDAAQTVRHLLADLASAGPRSSSRLDIGALMADRGFRPSSFEDWRRIEEAEAARGRERGRARTKVEAWHELLDLARRGRPGGPATPADRDDDATD